MKKQQKTYFLLLLVLIVWGILGFKIYEALGTEPDNTVIGIGSEDFQPKPTPRDTFSINANYPDPFLPRKKKADLKKPTETPSTPKVTTEIRYTGRITGSEGKAAIYFLTLDGQSYMLEAGQTIDEIKLIDGSASEIRVSDHGTTRIIKKDL